MGRVKYLVQAAAIKLILVYRYAISPFLGANCRYYPSCSSYMITAIERFGLMRGLYLGSKRLGRCHPWGPGGVDPVPDKKERV